MADFVVSLHPGQSAIYNSVARFKVVAAGRRFGKSHFGAVTLILGALETTNVRGYTLTQEHGVYYVAPTFDQAKRIMWPKIRELAGYERNGGLIRNENINDGWIELISGRRIYIRGADNPDSLRGIALSRLVMDEYADMKSNVWDEILRPALMDVEGDALFIGTPKGKNHFYKVFMGALHRPSPEWADWEAFHFKSDDNPFIKKHELAAMRGGTQSNDTVRQEIDASFVSGGSKMLKPDDFPILHERPGIVTHDGAGRQMIARGGLTVYITVDLAGFKTQEGKKLLRTDESVICETAQVGDEWIVLNMQHGHWDVREVALRIIRTCSKYDAARLGIEQGMAKEAVLPYMEEYMRSFNRYVNVETLRHGGNKKTDRILWALQGRSQRGKISLVEGEWNQWFLDQVSDFPDPLSHDDGLDALAYVDQIAKAGYSEYDEEDIQQWQVLDVDSGY